MNHPALSVLVLLAVAYVFTIGVIMHYDQVGLGRALIKGLPAFLGELGEPESGSTLVQASIIASLFISLAFLTVITAAITTSFVEFCRKGGRVLSKVNLSNHLVVCGWNFQGHKIIHELLSADPDKDIVVLAKNEHRPLPDERIIYISGDPTQDSDLLRAGVDHAESVIILSDLTKGANDADAEALMITLAVETLNRAAYTSVQVLSAANRVHLERAHADEIICLDQMGGSLVVASALNHGVSYALTELLTFDFGSEFYRYDKPLSHQIEGMEFREAVKTLVAKGIILFGFETDVSDQLKEELKEDILQARGDADRVIVVNPVGNYKLRQGDALFIIAEEMPEAI